MSEEQDFEHLSRDSKLARKHKVALRNILDELLDAMESARIDGFITEFTIQRDPSGAFALPAEHPALIKRW